MRMTRRLAAALGVGGALLGCSAGPVWANAPNAQAAPLSAVAAAPSLKPLSPADARAYTLAFAAARKGDGAGADRLAATIGDHCLFGRLAWVRLNGGGRSPELSSAKTWLLSHRDLPEAEQAAAIIVKAGAKEQASDEAAQLAAAITARKTALKAEGLASREAFYRGEIATAETLALASGERWIAGLAAYRLKRFPDAVARFSALAADPTETEWVRSGAAFWAARASVAAGRPAQSLGLLKLAARTPFTFYGLVAERQLGLDPAVTGHGVSYAAMMGRRAPTPAEVAQGAELARMVADDPRAHRAAAYAQLGLGVQSGLELRAAALSAKEGRQAWGALAERLGVPLANPRDFNPGETFRFDLAAFQTPALTPLGGFTLDKALVYALVRQESRFDPATVSNAGAYGLMQLMPATAARISGDAGILSAPNALHEPSLNLRIGQDYFKRLIDVANGDLLRAVASYNIGPGVLLKMNSRMEADTDSLLMIESMPGAETRDFVQRVLANYWIYRKIFGQDSRTLDAVANGAKSITVGMDR